MEKESTAEKRALIMTTESWKINTCPEYRGFRCGNCLAEISRAFHHLARGKNHVCYVHLCKKCEESLAEGKMKPGKKRSRAGLRLTAPKKAVLALARASEKWVREKPVMRAFRCDACGKKLEKAFHVWFRHRGKITEGHLCLDCGKSSGLEKNTPKNRYK